MRNKRVPLIPIPIFFPRPAKEQELQRENVILNHSKKKKQESRERERERERDYSFLRRDFLGRVSCVGVAKCMGELETGFLNLTLVKEERDTCSQNLSREGAA